MADYKESSGFCPTCQRQVVVRKEQKNDVFWLLAVLFSCGLFVIFWIISSLNRASQPYHCSVCGTNLPVSLNAATTVKKASSLKVGRIALFVFIGLVFYGLVMSITEGKLGSTQG